MKRLFIILITAATTILCVSCGITRASISHPAEGTSTTITITTNNPISTSVPVNVDADVLNKSQ